MPKSPHLCHMSISTNLRDLHAVIWQEFESTPILQSSQELAAAVVLPLQLVLTVPTSLLLCLQSSSVFCASFVLSSTGTRLILWIRPTFCAQMAFLTTMPTNNVLAWIRILVLMLTSPTALAITFPCLAFLASFVKTVHIHRIWGARCRNCLECELTSVRFNVSFDFTSNLLARDQSCTVHGNLLFQFTRNKSFKCGCLDVLIKSCCRRSTRFAPLVSADQFFPFLKSCGNVMQCASIWNLDLSQKRSAPSLRGSQRQTNRLNASRPDGAVPRTISKLFTVCQRHECNMNMFTLPDLLQLVLHLSDQNVDQMLIHSWWRCLDLPPIRSLAGNLNHKQQSETRGLPEHLNECRIFSFERWQFAQILWCQPDFVFHWIWGSH